MKSHCLFCEGTNRWCWSWQDCSWSSHCNPCPLPCNKFARLGKGRKRERCCWLGCASWHGRWFCVFCSTQTVLTPDNTLHSNNRNNKDSLHSRRKLWVLLTTRLIQTTDNTVFLSPTSQTSTTHQNLMEPQACSCQQASCVRHWPPQSSWACVSCSDRGWSSCRSLAHGKWSQWTFQSNEHYLGQQTQTCPYFLWNLSQYCAKQMRFFLVVSNRLEILQVGILYCRLCSHYKDLSIRKKVSLSKWVVLSPLVLTLTCCTRETKQGVKLLLLVVWLSFVQHPKFVGVTLTRRGCGTKQQILVILFLVTATTNSQCVIPLWNALRCHIQTTKWPLKSRTREQFFFFCLLFFCEDRVMLEGQTGKTLLFPQCMLQRKSLQSCPPCWWWWVTQRWCWEILASECETEQFVDHEKRTLWNKSNMILVLVWFSLQFCKESKSKWSGCDSLCARADVARVGHVCWWLWNWQTTPASSWCYPTNCQLLCRMRNKVTKLNQDAMIRVFAVFWQGKSQTEQWQWSVQLFFLWQTAFGKRRAHTCYLILFWWAAPCVFLRKGNLFGETEHNSQQSKIKWFCFECVGLKKATRRKLVLPNSQRNQYQEKTQNMINFPSRFCFCFCFVGQNNSQYFSIHHLTHNKFNLMKHLIVTALICAELALAAPSKDLHAPQHWENNFLSFQSAFETKKPDSVFFLVLFFCANPSRSPTGHGDLANMWYHSRGNRSEDFWC